MLPKKSVTVLISNRDITDLICINMTLFAEGQTSTPTSAEEKPACPKLQGITVL
jgi:hypothetical protein